MNFLLKPRLGWWNAYFIGKLYLYWKGTIGFHPIENLALLIWLAYPLEHRTHRWLRTLISVPLAVILLYHDSWLPKFDRVLSQSSLLKSFDSVYLAELLGRFINLQILAILLLMGLAYWLIGRWIRVGLLVSLAIITSLVAQITSGTAAPTLSAHNLAPDKNGHTPNAVTSVDEVLGQFFLDEKQRKVVLPKAGDQHPFDLIFIHICSLSWDDLTAVGLDNHPLWKRLDITLTHFNAAASYSGPAAVRLLRAPCGQEPHAGLYGPAPQDCYLMDNLRQAGFTDDMALNHDGHFEDFLKLVQKQHFNQQPLSLEQVTVAQHAFDDSPIFDDYAVLSRWLTQRRQQPNAPHALYYNTISLHDGNRLVGHPKSENSHQTYRLRVAQLLDELDHFMNDLDSSNQRTVVVIVPEHGAAYRGDKMQIAGLREIPSPSVTLVPVGIKIIASHAPRLGGTVTVGDSTSFLALSQLIANLIKNSPFDLPSGYRPADYAQNLPTTPFVAQQGDESIVRFNGQYFLQQDKDGPWSPYEVGP